MTRLKPRCDVTLPPVSFERGGGMTATLLRQRLPFIIAGVVALLVIAAIIAGVQVLVDLARVDREGKADLPQEQRTPGR